MTSNSGKYKYFLVLVGNMFSRLSESCNVVRTVGGDAAIPGGASESSVWSAFRFGRRRSIAVSIRQPPDRMSVMSVARVQ